jgi:CubicO group peptidase (beta-lactamase class C family)
MKGATFLLTLLLFFYSSCLKKDKVLPLLSSAGTMDSVVIGEQYQEVVYYDFEMKKIVATAKVDDWDLSFESNDSGTHVFINGGKTWNGANGTVFWVDPKEQMVVVMMGVAPGDIRKVHREQLNAVIYGALEK